MDQSNPDIMNVEEIASYLRVPTSSVYKLAQDSKIPCQKVGRHWRFHKEAINQWLANRFATEQKT